MSAIEEVMSTKKFIKDQLHGKITTFEMREFSDSLPKTKTSFKASTLEKTSRDEKYVVEFDDGLDEIEANFVDIMQKGTSKFKGKFPFKCFTCGEIGHYASRCLERIERKRKKFESGSRIVKKCYYVRDIDDYGVIYDDSDDTSTSANEFLFIAIQEKHVSTNPTSYVKEEKPMEESALSIQVEIYKDEWIIDRGCSLHLTDEKIKFVSLEKYDGGLVRFGDDETS